MNRPAFRTLFLSLLPSLLLAGVPETPLELPLRETRVQARVEGMVARIQVVQVFENRNTQALEALYTFPLPTGAAVSAYAFRMDGRTVRGKLKTREEARQTYEKAREAGKTASLLDQDRPNVFNQSLANVPPGKTVEVTLEYDQELAPDDGRYAFVFPTVVGPRFFPASMQPSEVAPLAPPVLASGTPNPHAVRIALDLETGFPVRELSAPWHRVTVRRESDSLAPVHVELAEGTDLPDRDFRLEYRLADEEVRTALLARRVPGTQGGHFLLQVQPPAKAQGPAGPHEILLLIDQSGSMNGAPLATIQEAARFVTERLRPSDRLQIVSFSDRARRMADSSLPVTAENRRRILSWINGLRSEGSTEMLSGVRAALTSRRVPGMDRHVVLLTDGYIGNEEDIFQAVRSGLGSSTWLHCFEVGTSVNHHLLEGAAREGKGLNLPLELGRDPAPALGRFLQRLEGGVLQELRLDWGGLPVADLEPQEPRDLFVGQPLAVAGRFLKAGKGVLTLRGKRAGQDVAIPVPVDFEAADTTRAGLSRLWARRRLAGTRDAAAGTELALQYGLLSSWTSFVAVLDSVVVRDGKRVVIDVPVELPRGVSPLAVGRTAGSGTAMDLGAGQIQGYLDAPQAIYILQEDDNGMAGISLERSLVEAVQDGRRDCSPLPTRFWNLTQAYGAREVKAVTASLDTLLPRLDLPAGGLQARVRLVVEPDGRVSLARRVDGLSPDAVENAVLAWLVRNASFGRAEGFSVVEFELSAGRICPDVPGLQERP